MILQVLAVLMDWKLNQPLQLSELPLPDGRDASVQVIIHVKNGVVSIDSVQEIIRPEL